MVKFPFMMIKMSKLQHLEFERYNCDKKDVVHIPYFDLMYSSRFV